MFVTVQDTGGAFGLEGSAKLGAFQAGLPALIKTAEQEWPTASLAAIDIDRGQRSAAQRPGAGRRALARRRRTSRSRDGSRRTLRSFASAD
jgi:hypothetical protein